MKKFILFGSAGILLFLASCDKEATIPDRFTPIPQGNTNIKFLNLSPGSPAVNFYVNGAKSTAFNPATGGVETGMSYNVMYPSTIGYATLPGGSLKIDAVVIPTSTIQPGATLVSASQTFEPGKFYTFAMVDTFTQAKAVVLEDDPNVPDLTKAYFRIANFLANSPVKVEVLKTSADYPYSKTFDNVAPRTALPYDSLGAGSGQVYKILLRNPTTNARLDSIVNFTPVVSKKYTFYVRGGLATTGTTRPIISTYTNF